MELQYFGANCLKITTKKAVLVVDDNLKLLGSKSITKDTDISLITSTDLIDKAQKAEFSIESPGEYELLDVVVRGIGVRAHMDEDGKKSAVIYKITAMDSNVVIAGHIHPDLTDDELEKIGLVDVLVVPVGGNGFTLDPVGALQVIKKIEPKVVIPVHFADKSLKYDVVQTSLDEALKVLSMEPTETVDKYKIKPTELSDSTHLVLLNKS